jgi:chromosome segregation ATPase
LRQFEFAYDVARDYVLELEHLSGKRFLRESLFRGVKEDLARLAERCSVAEQALVERDARLREMEDDRTRWMERCSTTERALVGRDARLREMQDDRTRWMERCSTTERALVERNARLRESEEDRERWKERCSAVVQEGQQCKEQFLQATNLLKERDLEIAAIRSSATWRWSQSALRSWPAQLLLGPFIRAVSGHRKA